MKQTLRSIARDLEIDRKTVREYRDLARKKGWLNGAVPDLAAVAVQLKERAARRAAQASSVEPYRDLILEWRAKRLEGVAIHKLLQERGFKGTYSAVRRFIRKLSDVAPDACVRIEVAPGQEAQVDFGYAGEIYDPQRGKLRRA